MLLTKNILEYGLPVAITLIVAITVFQDLLAALLLDRGFYLSESLLFKVVWLLFLPMGIGLWYFLKKTAQRFQSVWAASVLVILIAVLHLLFAGAMITVIAQEGLALPFTFSGIEKYLIVHQGALVILLYGLITGLILYVETAKNKASGSPIPSSYPEMVSVRHGRKTIPIPIKEILYIQSENPYSCIVTPEGKYLTSKSLKQLQGEMDPEKMVRVHRSTIVNVEQIKELKSRLNGDYDLLLHNGKMLRWSRNYPNHLKEVLRLAK